MGTTIDNLMAAFAGESQANRKYLAFAKKADEEGYPQVARLFRAAAAAETVHALTHLRTAGEVRSTEENLKQAVAGENYESVVMYPEFIAAANQETERKALSSFRWAMEAEKVHESLYQEALDSLGDGAGEEFDYYVCPVCGYTHKRSAPEKCPVCSTPGSRFEQVH
jgi:rubrerythrin